MGKKSVLIALFVSVTMLSILTASENRENRGTVISVSYSPETLKAGARAFVRIRSAGKPLHSSAPLQIKNDRWFHVENTGINSSENEILVWFVPFDSSIKTFPEIEWGELVFTGIPISVETSLAAGSSLSFPEGKLLLPMTRLILAAAVAAVILLVTAFSLAFRYLPEKTAKLTAAARQLSRGEILKARIRNLLAKAGKMEQTEFSALFMVYIREYLEATTGKNFSCLTTSEILEAAGRGCGLAAGDLMVLDMAHYGDASFGEAVLKEAAERVFSSVLAFAGEREGSAA